MYVLCSVLDVITTNSHFAINFPADSLQTFFRRRFIEQKLNKIKSID